MERVCRKDLKYEWDIHLALEIGERIFRSDCYMHYFTSLRALELYERVREKLGESKKELVLLLCFQVILKVHATKHMLTDDITGFAGLYSPQHGAVTKKASRKIEMAIINAVGSALHPYNCETGKEGVVDAWRYRLPSGEAPPPLPPAMPGKQMGEFVVVARTKKNFAMMHHWDAKNIILVTESIVGKMDCNFMTKAGSEIKDPAVREVHSSFFALCRIDVVMAKMLDVHLRANRRAAAKELDAYVVEEGLSFGRGHKRLMSSFRPAVESCLRTLLRDVENIVRFVELGGVAGHEEWVEMDQLLAEYEKQSRGLAGVFHEWGWPIEDSVGSRELDVKINEAAAKARGSREAQTAISAAAAAISPEHAVVGGGGGRACKSPRRPFEVGYSGRADKKMRVIKG